MIVRGVLRRLSALLGFVGIMLTAFVAIPAQAKWYVDNKLGEVKPEEKVSPVHPKPVQLLFEFQRDGMPNPKATKLTNAWALDNLKATGAFSEVTLMPAADGAVLSVKFNNVIKKEEMDKAKKDGFSAGLGFGLFGGVVATDHYVVTLTYVPATGTVPITTVVEHALHMKYGNTKVEVPGIEVKKADDAVKMVMRQALERGVNTIIADPAFPQ